MQATTMYGLEQLLALELKELGAVDVKIKNRAVEFYGDKGFMYKANYSLRTALRILKPLYSFQTFNEDHFYEKIKEFPWENYLDVNQTFAISANVHSEKFTHSQFMMFKMKDAIVDRFRDKKGERPDIATFKPDIRFNLHISDREVSIALDSSGDALFKRGYRKSRGEAPLNEVLAAGILKLAGWNGKDNLLDPMCGSGTFLIEAVMIAANLPPQLFRKDFGFQNWKDYDDDLFEKIKQFRMQRTKDFTGKIIGYDGDRSAVENARNNLDFTGFDEFVTIEHKNFFDSKKELFPLLVVFNPPYDERMEVTRVEEFYGKIGSTLKHNYPNTLSWILTSNFDAMKNIGLKPSKKIKLFNGKLECRLLQFEMYEGSKKQSKK
ncbi:MAG: class I SAM-dependent RNA methyltransferase [Flavobacteriales bacterium]|nr:class I SAM-dependent RNA methyltransferase [Flavobacteriales bacterium]